MESQSLEPLFIEFDGRQVTFTTEVPSVHDFVAATFRHMLVRAVTSSAGNIRLLRVDGGHELQGRETIFLGGMHIEPVFHFVKDEVRSQFMHSRGDLLWLHAGAVERDGAALLLSGPSGQGKSTLATILSESGWKYMSDDVAPVRLDSGKAIPFPQAPSRRLHPGREVAVNEVATLPRETALLASDAIARREVPVRAIVFITYDSQQPALMERLSQGHSALALLSNLTNFMDHRSSAVEGAARFARKIPMFSLRYADSVSGATALSRLWTES